MFLDNADFQSFYHSRGGWLIRKIIRAHVSTLIGEDKYDEVLGLGYATPYLEAMEKQAKHFSAAMPAGIGGHIWPKYGDNKVAVVSGTELPYESNSLDLVVAVHFLEFSEYPEYALKEIWRVLKSNSSLILVVPNRMSMWARAEWSPFGHGQPFSSMQLKQILQACLFVPEEEKNALFFPPWQNRFIYKSAWQMERFGQVLCPALGGVRVLRASKQIYAPTKIKGSAVPVSPFKIRKTVMSGNKLNEEKH